MPSRSQRPRSRQAPRRGTLGGSPGQILVDPDAPRPKIHVFGYGAEGIEEKEVAEVGEIRPFLDRYSVTWVNVDGLGDPGLLTELGELFGVHPLALEDVVNIPQRPKVEAYDDQLFIVVHMLSRAGSLGREQLSLYLGDRFLLSFQEHEGDPLDPVRDRLRSGRGRIRHRGPDYLAYTLIDSVLDHYFPVLEDLQENLSRLEDELRVPGPDPLRRVQDAREELLQVQRATSPLREVTRSLASAEWPLVDERTRKYFRDCHDHAISATEILEGCRQVASGLMDIHLSTLSHQVNTTMKVLTVIATIFMPLSFIAGVYGMNFNPELPGNMPELGWPYAYVGVLGAMAAIGIGLLVYFRRKGWF